jgi:hypothetical protein
MRSGCYGKTRENGLAMGGKALVIAVEQQIEAVR